MGTTKGATQVADEKARQNWVYAEITSDERSVLRRMAKAEGKTPTQLTQEIMYPALQAELKSFTDKEATAAKEAADAKAKADAEAKKNAPAAGGTVDTSQFAGAAKS